MKTVEKEIDARERASVSVCPVKKQRREYPTAAALFSNNSSPACSYCDQPHSSSSCQTITDLGRRKQILMKSGRCFVCLKKGHISKDCRHHMDVTVVGKDIILAFADHPNHLSKTLLRAPNISYPVNKVTTLLRLLVHRHRRSIQPSSLLYYPCTSVPEPLCWHRQQELKSSNLTNPITPWMSE